MDLARRWHSGQYAAGPELVGKEEADGTWRLQALSDRIAEQMGTREPVVVDATFGLQLLQALKAAAVDVRVCRR